MKTSISNLTRLQELALEAEKKRLATILDEEFKNKSREDKDRVLGELERLRSLKETIENIQHVLVNEIDISTNHYELNQPSIATLDILKQQIAVLENLSGLSEEPKSLAELIIESNQLEFHLSTSKIWARRVSFILALLATALVVIAATLLLILTIHSFGAIGSAFVLGITAFGALFGFCPPAQSTTPIDINDGIHVTVTTPVNIALAPLGQGIVVPYLLRTRIANYTVTPPHEMKIRGVHDGIMNQLLVHSRQLIDEKIADKNIKKLLIDIFDQTKSLLQKAQTSMFEGTRQTYLKKAKLILYAVTKIIDEKQYLQCSKKELLEKKVQVEKSSTSYTLCQILNANRSPLFSSCVTKTMKALTNNHSEISMDNLAQGVVTVSVLTSAFSLSPM